MKAGLIGCGFMGTAHKNAYEALRCDGANFELVAICDIRAEQLVPLNNERLYTDLDEMLAKETDLDFVSLCLPTFLHAEYAIKCMKAGLNVLCEKPMSLSYDDCQKMLECSRETGKRLMIGQVCRFSPERRVIKAFLEEGRFGKPVAAFFTSPDGAPTWGWGNWFADGKRSGGAMLDLQAHNIDLINWFFGMPKYTSTTAKQFNKDFTGYGTISSNMVYEDGMFVHSYCDWGVENNKHLKRMVRINFESGYLYYNGGPNPELVAVDVNGEITDLSGLIERGKPALQREIEYFATCLKEGRPFDACPPEESAKVLKIMRAQEKSADACGAPVVIE